MLILYILTKCGMGNPRLHRWTPCGMGHGPDIAVWTGMHQNSLAVEEEDLIGATRRRGDGGRWGQ
jgi:hypothetical protein